uniref:Uncharacterized protein n=1 Tax=Arundo donax TaxID=35708 RepID=A0A0A8XWN6_ARUDO
MRLQSQSRSPNPKRNELPSQLTNEIMCLI